MPENTALFEELAQGLAYPEGACWSELDQCLYFVEWTGDRVCRLHNGQVEAVFYTPKGSGPCGLCQDQQGDFWLCLYSACQLVHYNRNGRPLHVYDRHAETVFSGPNDLVMDAQGGLYFTDSGNFEQDWITGRAAGVVYYLDSAGEMHRVASGICYANGIALSSDGKRLFVNEHRQNRVLVYPVASDGSLGASKLLARLDKDSLLEAELAFELGPDGMCLDGRGRVWLAHFGGGKLIGLNLAAREMVRVQLPRGRRPTNLAWQPQQDCLYITEAELGLLYRCHLQQLPFQRR